MKIKSGLRCRSILLSSFTTLSAPVFAQNSILMEEVIVTAQKREQSMQDVGVAVTAFSQQQLENLGFKDSTDISLMTPGVHVSGALGGQLQTFTIRGVAQSDFIEVAESPNAVYIDEAYVGFMSGARFAMFDLDRVEVLKGPQGTLFGRNATGGLVHYLSQRPTNETEGYADLTYGSYNQVRLEAALGGALSESVRGRIAVYSNTHDGVKENDLPGGDDEGNDDSQAIRGQLEFDLSESVTLLLKADIGRSKISTSPYYSVTTYTETDAAGTIIDTVEQPSGTPDFFGGVTENPERRSVTQDFSKDDLNTYDSDAFTAILTMELASGATLTSVTDYREYEKETYLDNEGQAYSMLNFFSEAENEQFSQELRLSGSTDRTRWTTGAYYLDYSTLVDTGTFVDGLNVLGLPATWMQNTPDLETTSLSIFGQVELDFAQDLTFIAGARIIEEEKEYSHSVTWYDYNDNNDDPGHTGVVSGLYTLVGGYPTANDDASDTLWSGKLQLEWRPNDDLLIYAGVNRGIKAGSYNQDLGGLGLFPAFSGGSPSYLGDAIPTSYDEEVLLAYELGFKSVLMDGKARLNGAAFHYDYQDFQAFRYTGLSFYVTNQDATSTGLELDFVVSPIDGLDISLSAAYIDMEVQDVVFDAGERDVSPPYAPELQASGLIRYGWDALGGRLAAQLSASYSDSFYSTATNFSSTEYPSYTLVDVRLSYTTSDGAWVAEIFGKNVTDEFRKTVGFDLSGDFGFSQYAMGEPEWYGARLRYNF